jgi:hypothetical protein
MPLIDEYEPSIISALREAAESFKDNECDGIYSERNIIILDMIRYRNLLYRNRDDEKKTLKDIKSIIQKNLNEEIERKGKYFVEENFSSIYIPMQLVETPVLVGIDTGVRMIYASCCAPLNKKDAPLKDIMDICLEIVEESNLLASTVMIPDARQANRWCLCVNLASPS